MIYRGDEPIPGAIDKVLELRTDGIDVVFCTNNSRSTVPQYVAKLTALGLPIEADSIVTSAVVTGEVLSRRGGRRAMVIGGDGLTAAVTEAGYEIVPPPDRDVDVVVVGWDLDFDFSKLRRAVQAITGGAAFVASNDDKTFPAPDGVWPGTGALVASIETATGVSAEVMGKPHEPMMDAVARRMDGRNRIAIVGDRPDTDLAGGRARGWTTILVLSGVTTESEARSLDPAPDVILGSLADLVV